PGSWRGLAPLPGEPVGHLPRVQGCSGRGVAEPGPQGPQRRGIDPPGALALGVVQRAKERLHCAAKRHAAVVAVTAAHRVHGAHGWRPPVLSQKSWRSRPGTAKAFTEVASHRIAENQTLSAIVSAVSVTIRRA